MTSPSLTRWAEDGAAENGNPEDAPKDPPSDSEDQLIEIPADAQDHNEDTYGEFLNVQEFGAVGDGQSDDTAAIQNVLDGAADGDTVYLPAGDYLVSRSSWGGGPILTVPTDVADLTILGDVGYNETRIFVAEREYDDDRNFAVLRIPVNRNVVEGLKIRNLTVDGNRPPGDYPRYTHGIQFYPSGAGGGHDILVEDCWVENFAGAAVVCREGRVTFNRITSVNNRQNFGVSEMDDSTAGTDRYGVTIQNSVSKNADWVGIDHNKGGRVRIANVYSENNGHSGFKTTKDNRRTRIENVTFQGERYDAAVRTNISTTADIPDAPVELSLDTVAIRDALGGGIYISGDNSSVQNSALIDGPIEIRNCGGASNGGGSHGALTVHGAGGGSIEELRVIGTQEGPAVWFDGNHEFTIDTLYHKNNEGGAIGPETPHGNLQFGALINSDPGRLDTPEASDVGAWSRHS
ncbi:glycosyl hydrolase family 28-related protein [Halovenus marina]|uniref:glycosyl hydrolase family 28-related protein n=1 Tax=Halovenus marina TaxID=3396621 RepID=UPI003F572C9E